MKVYVENKDKDFLELCLKEHCVYDYIEYDSRYRDKLELVSLADYTKQVRKEVCEEIKQEVKTLIESKDFKLCNHEYANGYCYGLQYDLAKILYQIQGE